MYMAVSFDTVKRVLGVLAPLSGGVVGLLVMFGPMGRRYAPSPGEPEFIRTISGIDYLLGVEGADPALFYWSLFILGVSLLGGYGVHVENNRLVWVVTLLLLGFSIAAIFSIRIIALPAAHLFLIYSTVLTYDSRIRG